MNNFFMNLMFKLQRFMYGRYGFDKLSAAMVVLSLIVFVVSLFVFPQILYPIYFALLILAYARCFSRNIYARRRELEKYMRIREKIAPKVSLCRQMWKERKTYKYFRCKNCGAYWRVPKGRGKIEITCRNCKHKMIKKA